MQRVGYSSHHVILSDHQLLFLAPSEGKWRGGKGGRGGEGKEKRGGKGEGGRMKRGEEKEELLTVRSTPCSAATAFAKGLANILPAAPLETGGGGGEVGCEGVVGVGVGATVAGSS